MHAHIPDHPDLVDVGHRLQSRLDRVLEAEQEAAAVLARRTSTLRDRMLDAEDTNAWVTITSLNGRRVTGRVAVVAQDHIELHDRSAVLIAMDQILSVEFP